MEAYSMLATERPLVGWWRPDALKETILFYYTKPKIHKRQNSVV
jgi:hypothetical protein